MAMDGREEIPMKYRAIRGAPLRARCYASPSALAQGNVMPSSSASVALWRGALVVLALMAAAQVAIDVFHAPRQLALGVRGEALFQGGFLHERGPTTFVVDALPAGSPLAAVGVVPGDRVQWEA